MLFAGAFSKLRGWLYHIATRPGLVLLYMLHFDILIFLLLDFAILAFLFLSCSIFTNLHDLTSASALASNLSRSGVPFLPINSSKTSSSVYVFMSRRIKPLFNCCRSRVCPSLCRCFWLGTFLYHHYITMYGYHAAGPGLCIAIEGVRPFVMPNTVAVVGFQVF